MLTKFPFHLVFDLNMRSFVTFKISEILLEQNIAGNNCTFDNHKTLSTYQLVIKDRYLWKFSCSKSF